MMRQVSKQDMQNFFSQRHPYCFTAASVLEDAAPTDLLLSEDSFFYRTKNETGFFVFCGTAAETEQNLEMLMSQMKPEDTLFCTYGNRLASMIHKHFKIRHSSDCKQLLLPDSVAVCENEEGIIDLREDQAAYIHNHYEMRHVLPVSYMRERILVGPAIGVMVDNVLAGWVMTHDERAMGVLEVLPQYRRMGLASRLNGAMVRRMRKLGFPCIVEILNENHASLALAAASGFEYLQDVHWLITERELLHRQS